MTTGSNALIELMKQEMAAQQGNISFSRFMELALYEPHFGYYFSENMSLGQQGDFTTAPEISPLFAWCFARQSKEIFAQINTKNILEIGAGSGRFASDFLQQSAQLNCLPDQYLILEISSSLRKKQQYFLQHTCPELYERIIWLDALPQRFGGIIIANEVLDALPIDCFHIEKDQVKERFVGWENDKFIWKLGDPTANIFTKKVEALREKYHLSDGYESEINIKLEEFITAITNCLSEGAILFADYGYGQEEYYHPERRQGTLTCFYRHQRNNDPLIHVGAQDITAHVDFTSVAEIATENGCQLAGYTTQAAFLFACGLMDFAAKASEGLSVTEEFKFNQAIKTLTLPSEMGEVIKIMGLTKNLDAKLVGFSMQDRRRDL